MGCCGGGVVGVNVGIVGSLLGGEGGGWRPAVVALCGVGVVRHGWDCECGFGD